MRTTKYFIMNSKKSETDWERVLAFKDGDAIPYEPEDRPYDPNDAGSIIQLSPFRLEEI